MANDKRLIEVAFPLKQTSLDSVHEKMCHSGHPKSIHIWPARRPLAASRATLIATLLHDPENATERRHILERMAGRVREKDEQKQKGKEETMGGILHWGQENDPDIDWFRQEIRKTYGGRAPKVLDPFSGGGAIPLEAMRLGCEVTANDINPVAWFILKCTLEYPHKFAGQTQPLPDFALKDQEFMESFLKTKGFKGSKLTTILKQLDHNEDNVQFDTFSYDDTIIQASLAWHVKAWGRWILTQVRKNLAPYYPTYAEFETLESDGDFETKPIQLLEVDEHGIPQIDPLNAEFDRDYLANPKNPRWIAKPTLAYLWARTVRCKQCRATIPLLKTRWLCKKSNKRVLVTMTPNADRTGVVFNIDDNVPENGANAAQRREHDKKIGTGVMTRTGAKCPCCETLMPMEDLRLEGQAGRIESVLYASVIKGSNGKEFRTPTKKEINTASNPKLIDEIEKLFNNSNNLLPAFDNPDALGFRLPRYGITSWDQLFNTRQLFTLGKICHYIQELTAGIEDHQIEWTEAISAYLTCTLSKCADYNSAFVAWQPVGIKGGHTFERWALPIKWDFIENNIIASESGGFLSICNWITQPLEDTLSESFNGCPSPNIRCQDALHSVDETFDLIVTDPPYYDAIAYADLMDFFYVWIKRCMDQSTLEFRNSFHDLLSPKWNHEQKEGELIDDPSRFQGDREVSKQVYETGMFNVFKRCFSILNDQGRFVIVFANKNPDAWETLVSALVKAGFVVDASWPIQTEMGNRTRAINSAALASSVWLVCRKRVDIRPGWDSSVLIEMKNNITQKLYDFWDAGIRGPDFVWAATGPALEAYSKYPVVKKADDPGEIMSVSEFLRQVRRLVVDFVVGRVLTGSEEGDDLTASESLDDITTYYLLHRHDFGMNEAPIGACILYALSCNLSDSALVNQYDLLAQAGRISISEEGGNVGDAEENPGGSSGANVRLKAWNQRNGRNLGLEISGGRPVPMIDQVHKLMYLWRAGDQAKVNSYIDSYGLKRNALFSQLLQALIELSSSDERTTLESLSNHIAVHEQAGTRRQRQLI